MMRFQRRWLVSLVVAACFAADASPCPAKTAPRGTRIARLQYRVGKGWVNVPRGPLCVLQDTKLVFRAVPAAGKWRRIKPRWSGPARNKGRGTHFPVTFARLARHRGDFQMVTVTAINRVHVPVLVYDLEPMMTPDDNFPGRSLTDFGIGEDVWLTVKITPFVPVAKLGRLEWAIDRFPGIASVMDFGAHDGTALFNVGGADETFRVRVKVLSCPSRGQTRDILMNEDPSPGKRVIEPGEREYYDDEQKIDAACRTMKLASLERTAAALEAKWRRRDVEHYLRLLERICKLLDSVDFGDGRRFAIAQHYARLAWPIAEKHEPGGGIRFLKHLLHDVEYDNGMARGAAWARLRREKTARWLQSIKNVEQSIYPRYHPDNRQDWGVWNVIPPVKLPGEEVTSGMAPEEIGDLKTRAIYQEALAEHHHQSRRLIAPRYLRARLNWLLGYGENYIVRAYARPPGDLAGLRLLLSQYDVEWSRAQRILRRVAAKSAQSAP